MEYGPNDDLNIPNTSPDGKYYTETTVILYQMLDQQVRIYSLVHSFILCD